MYVCIYIVEAVERLCGMVVTIDRPDGVMAEKENKYFPRVLEEPVADRVQDAHVLCLTTSWICQGFGVPCKYLPGNHYSPLCHRLFSQYMCVCILYSRLIPAFHPRCADSKNL